MNKKSDAKPGQEKPKRKTGRPAKAAAPKVVEDAAEATAPRPFDFVGKVEAIRVVGTPGAELFELAIRGRHGKHGSVRLRASDPFALSAMVPLIVAAQAGEAKIGVRVEQVDGVSWVVEIESRPGLGKKA